MEKTLYLYINIDIYIYICGLSLKLRGLGLDRVTTAFPRAPMGVIWRDLDRAFEAVPWSSDGAAWVERHVHLPLTMSKCQFAIGLALGAGSRPLEIPRSSHSRFPGFQPRFPDFRFFFVKERKNKFFELPGPK